MDTNNAESAKVPTKVPTTLSASKRLIIKKSIVERIPQAEALRRLKRKTLGYQPDTGSLNYTLSNYERIKSHIEAHTDVTGATVLEIGTGWFPVIPMMLLRDGAKKVYMTDLNRHMDDITFRATVNFLQQKFPKDAFIQDIESQADLAVEYLAPFDPVQILDASIDIITSRTVLEHIPKSDIYSLHCSLLPKLKKSGVVVHHVDHSDHFEHADKSISKINFLTWSEEKHARINYLIRDGENRLRHHEYPPIFEDAGYKVVGEEADVHQDTLNRVSSTPLAYPYSAMEPEQVATLASIYALKPG